jgi:hypothetical protein
MTDHHDFGVHDDGHHYDDHHDEPLPFDEPGHVEPAGDEHYGWDEHHDDPHDEPVADEHEATDVPGAEQHEPAMLDDPAGTVHDTAPELTDDPAEPVFPPAVDVGPLPEPVDGFPWIDTGSLGVVDPAAVHETTDPVRPEELAEYAGTDLPPGVDPWAALADSDDPATSALARWWSEN